MLATWLHHAGFFPIRWPAAAPGTTYVRPGATELRRVFVPQHTDEVEIYAGPLAEGRLCYRGPIRSEAELRQWLPAPRPQAA
ncbi:hypothetical protein EJV47_24080 [Hymenobacter gummosus]|uniref:Uncharacterized protein n=1 Tax=Hymenobacter gummosus TaxID=1776032 RepID=A0A3S0IJV6_9BACT|nr:hypothetical protein [Hymenobacter gummosus]RTQ45911.1 hypothetical protein EJV47_24080 [Hymenobacter gummosus]